MSLSRRQFTKEFKLAAIQRLETGASVAEAARAFEVNPNGLHRWRREFRQGPTMRFPAWGSGAGKRAGQPNWSARSASRRWRSIF
jgi:transposase-like protein